VPDPAASPLSAVLLDLDDTLVPWQTLSHWQWAFRPRGPVLAERHVRAAFRRQLHQWDRRRWTTVVGKAPEVDGPGYRSFLADLLTEIAGHPVPEVERNAVVDRFLRPAHEVESFPDAAPLVRALAERNVRVGVVATMPREAARWALHRAGLSEDLLVSSLDDPAPRPPVGAGLRAAAAKLGAKPRTTLYVGDLFWSDVRAAARAGCTAVLIDRAGAAAHVTGARIRSLAEVPAWLDRPPEPVSAPAPGPDESPPDSPPDSAP
jgi:FMN phosphatase YigB (HAD superfamily)